MLETLIVHDQHNQVHTFQADLKSSAATANCDECGCTPAFGRAAGSHSTSVFTTNDKPTFDQVGYDQDALCIVQYFFWNALVGRRHNGMNHIDRGLQPCHRIFPP